MVLAGLVQTEIRGIKSESFKAGSGVRKLFWQFGSNSCGSTSKLPILNVLSLHRGQGSKFSTNENQELIYENILLIKSLRRVADIKIILGHFHLLLHLVTTCDLRWILSGYSHFNAIEGFLGYFGVKHCSKLVLAPFKPHVLCQYSIAGCNKGFMWILLTAYANSQWSQNTFSLFVE